MRSRPRIQTTGSDTVEPGCPAQTNAKSPSCSYSISRANHHAPRRGRLGSRSDGIEFAILAADQLIGQREPGHRFEASCPCLETGPVGHVKAPFGHENHPAPTPDIGDRAIIPDQERLVLDRLVYKGQRCFSVRAKFGDRLRVGGTKPRRMADLGDIGDVVGLPREPLARLPALLLGPALEVPGLTR